MELINFNPEVREINPNEKFSIYKLTNNININNLKLPVILYVNLIRELSASNKIIVPLSGGVDSEVLFRAALQAGVDFVPVIMHFENDFNMYEIKNAYKLCEIYGKKPLVLKIDLDDFFRKEQHLYYAEKYLCRSPQLATHLWIMDQIQDGFFIFPYNPPPVLQAKNKKIYLGFPPLLYLCYNKYFELNRRPGISFLSMHTEEILYSYLKLPIYSSVFFDRQFFNIFTSDSYLFKTECYRQAGFNLNFFLKKATGFELYRSFLNKKYQMDKSEDFFDMNYRSAMEKIVNDPKYPATADIGMQKLYNYYSENPTEYE